MTELLNETPVKINKADHLVTVRANGGTAQLQYSVGGLAMADLPGSTYAADADEIKRLCHCDLQVVLTGNAVVHINEAGN
jgi:hypothetical protein